MIVGRVGLGFWKMLVVVVMVVVGIEGFRRQFRVEGRWRCG